MLNIEQVSKVIARAGQRPAGEHCRCPFRCCSYSCSQPSTYDWLGLPANVIQIGIFGTMRAPSGLLTVVHLFLWGQLGVLVRLYLDKLFMDGCSGRWGLCLVSGGNTSTHYSSYFSDLVPNMLGCFVIGFLSNHQTLGIKSSKPLGFLGSNHVFQQLSSLHVGLRVGFCGCLTTFSSWELQMVTMIIGGARIVSGQWAEALWGWVIGTELAMVSLLVGEQVKFLIIHSHHDSTYRLC